MIAEWDKLTAKCPRTLQIATYVLYINTAVNCYGASLLLRVMEYVCFVGRYLPFRDRIGTWGWCNVSWWLRSRLVFLLRCRLQTVFSLWSRYLWAELSLNPLSTQAAMQTDPFLFLQNHRHAQSFTDGGQVSEKNLSPATQSKHWVLADLFTLLIIKENNISWG